MKLEATRRPHFVARAVPGRAGGIEASLPAAERPLHDIDERDPSGERIVGYLHADRDGMTEPVRWTGPRPVAAAGDAILVHRSRTAQLAVFAGPLGGFPLFVTWDGKAWWISTSMREVALRARRRLDVGAALRWVVGERGDELATPLLDVLSVPAGATLSLREDGSVEALPPEEVPDRSHREHGDVVGASSVIVAALAEAIESAWPAGADGSLAVDLTSGLDSSVVAWIAARGRRAHAFTMIDGPHDHDCREEVVRAFAARHQIPLQVIDVGGLAPLATDGDRAWGRESCEAVAWERLARYLGAICSAGHAIRLTGEGADEVMAGWRVDRDLAGEAHALTFRHAARLRAGLADVLTEVGIARLAAAGAARQGHGPIPTSTVLSRRALFPLAWEHRVWPLAPFLDARVRLAAARLPPGTRKDQVWLSRSDIFVPEQLRRKTAAAGDAAAMIWSSPDAAQALLDGSFLARAGVLDPDALRRRLGRSDARGWLDTIAGTWLWRVFSLELFFQSLGDLAPQVDG